MHEIAIDSFCTNEKINDGFYNTSKDLFFLCGDAENYSIIIYKNKSIKNLGKLPFQNNIYNLFREKNNGELFIGSSFNYCSLSADGYGKTLKNTEGNQNEYFLNSSSKTDMFLVRNLETNDVFKYNKDIKIKLFNGEATTHYSSYIDGLLNVSNKENLNKTYLITDDEQREYLQFHYPDLVNHFTKISEGSYIVGTGIKSLRIFDYIKKYPKIYKNDNASATFSIQQDATGRIWSGSYNGGYSIIDTNNTIYRDKENLKVSNGGFTYKNKMYLIGEGTQYGLHQIDILGNQKKLTNNVSGFYNFIDSANNRLYFGTSQKGLWHTPLNKLDDNNPKEWSIINKEQGLTLPNTITITKDKKGRIWLGQASRGWAIYYPTKNKVVTKLINKNETDFGTMSSLTDTYGTVWLGTKQKSLLYYNNYKSDSISNADIQKLIHPLLVNGKTITALQQWNDWLLIGATEYYLAFNLKEWHKSKKVIIKYLNPQEAAFTGTTEQNTLLVDKRDSSVWFSTSDMLYQWDFKRWLSLPPYTVNTEVVLHNFNNTDSILQENKVYKTSATNNSFDLSVLFQSPDNMPRYFSVAFIKKGDSLFFNPPSLETKYSFKNLAQTDYELYVQICESDGTISLHKYNITINKFWWQLWWVWVLALLFFTSILSYIFNIRKQKKIVEQNALIKVAALETEKASQQKELANMQVVTLSNQFRPHFILNALNTIGAQMDDRPEAEMVLSRLGESINLIFGHSQQQKIAHAFADEWTLVKNIIELHKLMYLKQLEADLPTQEKINAFAQIKIPLGLLQIPVENALLHGLCNKEVSPWLLIINLTEDGDNIIVTIKDNGVGRKSAATLSNFTKHGTGTKNINNILQILNTNNKNKIIIDYEDDIYKDENKTYGTAVIITIPKQFDYEAK